MWGEHFNAVDDKLVPQEDNPDASYTHEAYDLDDPLKRKMRANRQEAIKSVKYAINYVPSRISRLLELAKSISGAERIEILNAARDLRLQLTAAKAQLDRFRAVPVDAPISCRCPTTSACSLPAFLDNQCLEHSILNNASGG